MKTITLDDTAYKRLESKKTAPDESFSSVIKRVVPETGTLGALLEFARKHRTGDLPNNDIMEESINERSSVKSDPWT